MKAALASAHIGSSAMKLLLLAFMLVAFGASQAIEAPTSAGPLIVQASERQGWVNTASGVYHYPGTRWYGQTKQGQYMSEAEARAKGYRPAKNGQLD
jgi:hypothetical protein